MLLRLLERVPIYSVKVDIIFHQRLRGPKGAYIAMDEVDKFLVDFSFSVLNPISTGSKSLVYYWTHSPALFTCL